MTSTKQFACKPTEAEAEKASNSYLMSLIALIAGLPLPVINLITTLVFYLNNRKEALFVRWHCTQALISQILMFFINSCGFWWTISIIFTDQTITNAYIGYIVTAVIFNTIEFIATFYAAAKTRKGVHVEWWFCAPIVNLLCKPIS